jgi:hypothetical protein
VTVVDSLQRQSLQHIDVNGFVPNALPESICPEKVELLESRPRHRYIFRRPRALQYTYQSRVLRVGEEETARELNAVLSPTSTEKRGPHISHHHENNLHHAIEKHREHLDLFIDLIWVGIIGHISEVFAQEIFKPGGANPRLAFLYFIVAFLPSWRIWNGVREFLTTITCKY